MIYHYTKGYALKSIFSDGFIATEGARGLSRDPKVTNLVWLTAQQRYPKTALPLISTIPSSDLALHYSIKNLAVDYEGIGAACAGLFRFGFNKNDPRLEQWWRSEERKEHLRSDVWRKMESIANRVGDEVRQFWIARSNLVLINYKLEMYDSGSWIAVLDSLDGTLSANYEDLVERLCENAERWADQFGLSQSDFRLAA